MSDGTGDQGSTASTSKNFWARYLFGGWTCAIIASAVTYILLVKLFHWPPKTAREYPVVIVSTVVVAIAVFRYGPRQMWRGFCRARLRMQLAAIATIACAVIATLYLLDPTLTLKEIIGAIAAVAGLATAIWTAFFSTWVSLRNQRIAVRMQCIQRYDEFALTRPDLSDHSATGKKRIETYFRRHWAIKKDQLDFWIAGYVDPEALLGWFMSDVGYFSGVSESIKKDLFYDSWIEVISKPGSVDPRLVELVTRIVNDAVDIHCPNCTLEPDKCTRWQRAALFWILKDLEHEWQDVIKARHADGVGRETFEHVLLHLSEREQGLIAEAGRRIEDQRKLENGKPQRAAAPSSKEDPHQENAAPEDLGQKLASPAYSGNSVRIVLSWEAVPGSKAIANLNLPCELHIDPDSPIAP